MLHSRVKRVEENLMHELAKILAYELSDPRIKFASVTAVKVSRDLSEAVAYVSFLDNDPAKVKEAMKGLESAKGFIKKILAEKVSLKRMPELQFKYDSTLDQSLRVEKLLHQIEHEPPVE